MDLFGNKKAAARLQEIELKQESLDRENKRLQEVNAIYRSMSGYSVFYNGEKTNGELGLAYEFGIDYYTMRMRAWEGLIKSSIVQTAIKNYCLWIVGSGLKFSCEPNEEYLALRNITIDKKKFSNNVEAQFRLYAKDKESTYSKEMSLHGLASEALKNAILAGDVLVITRYEGYQPTVEIIDGCFVKTNFSFVAEAESRGNYVIDGVEINKRGQHVSYHVQLQDGTFQRVLSYPSGIKGERQAWLMYGLRHKITDTRGLSLLSAVMERDAKLDRYLEASVGSAEENSKIPYTFEHTQYSDGTNPLLNQVAAATGASKTPIDNNVLLSQYANKIALSTQKQVYNLPVGAKLVAHNEHSDPNFDKFYTPNAELIFATIGIPAEVALSKFGGSYSGSRAAIKGWEFKMRVEREMTLSDSFYRPIYRLWFLINFYKGNIEAIGYGDAVRSNDWLIRSAYMQCKFIGQSVPHIDPVKEATAERIKLGSAYDAIPLQTGEQACENGNAGDFNEVQKIAERELECNKFKEENDSIVKTAKNIVGKIIEKNITESLEN